MVSAISKRSNYQETSNSTTAAAASTSTVSNTNEPFFTNPSLVHFNSVQVNLRQVFNF